jgi:hypothetical protein
MLRVRRHIGLLALAPTATDYATVSDPLTFDVASGVTRDVNATDTERFALFSMPPTPPLRRARSLMRASLLERLVMPGCCDCYSAVGLMVDCRHKAPPSAMAKS